MNFNAEEVFQPLYNNFDLEWYFKSYYTNSKKELEQNIAYLYELFKLNPPKIQYFKSPMAAQLALFNSGGPQTSFANNAFQLKTPPQPSCLAAERGEKIGRKIWEFIGEEIIWPLCVKSWKGIGKKQFHNAKNAYWQPIHKQSVDQLKSPIQKQVERILVENGLSKTHDDFHLGIQDLGLLLHYKELNKHLHFESKAFDCLQAIVEFGIWGTFAFENYLAIVEPPIEIHYDLQLVQHNEDGPTVTWADGYKNYFWNGVDVNQRLIEQAYTIDYEYITTETNAERRRAIQEKLSSRTFANLLGLVKLDENVDLQNNKQALYRTKEFDSIAQDYLYFAQVVCPSSFREYFLCVPPHTKTVSDAVAWTFGKNSTNYKPSIET